MMRRWLAGKLRTVATLLDGEDYRKLAADRWAFHLAQMRVTNKYIGTAERYIVALERALGEKASEIRKRHPGRFDTSRLVDAEAWSKTLN